MTALLVFVMALPRPNWVALALVVVLAVPLVWWELRAATPFFDIRGLVANGALTRTYLRTALTLLGAYTVMYGVTQWLEAARGMSTEERGPVPAADGGHVRTRRPGRCPAATSSAARWSWPAAPCSPPRPASCS